MLQVCSNVKFLLSFFVFVLLSCAVFFEKKLVEVNTISTI